MRGNARWNPGERIWGHVCRGFVHLLHLLHLSVLSIRDETRCGGEGPQEKPGTLS